MTAPSAKKKILSDRRYLRRISVEASTGFTAYAVSVSGEKIRGDVLDFNSMGASIRFLGSQDLEKIRSEFSTLEIWLGKTRTGRIDHPNISRFDSERQAVVVLFSPTRFSNKIERKSQRLQVRDSFRPIVIAVDPTRLNWTLHFDVKNFSSSGLEVSTSFANRHLMPGMRLEKTQLVLPGASIAEASLEVQYARVEGKKMSIGMRFIDPSSSLLTVLAQFALYGANGPQTEIDRGAAHIHRAGLPLKSLSKGIAIEAISTPEEYVTVLQNRLVAYKSASKVSSDATVESMADEFDNGATIIAARIDGQVIGSARIVRHSLLGKFHFEAMYGTTTIPEQIKANSVEISRLAILPSFQGTDLVVGFFQAICEMLTRAGTQYVLCTATEALEPLYFRLGATKIRGGAKHPTLANETLSLLSINVSDFLNGRGISGLCWEKVAQDVALHLETLGIVKQSKRRVWLHFRAAIERIILTALKAQKKKVS